MDKIYFAFILLFYMVALIYPSDAVRAPEGKKLAKAVQSTDNTRAMSTILNNPSKLQCGNQSDSILDFALHKLLNQKFPTNARQLRQFCNQAQRIIEFVDVFLKQCLNEFTKKIVSFVFFPIKREFKTVCKSGKPGPKARELMVASNCGNHARPGLRKCYNVFVDQELGMQQVIQKQRIPMRIQSITSVFHIGGRGGKASDRCVKVINNIPEINMTDTDRPMSFISPLITIFGDLGDDDITV
ncbi:unnamed protein product [Oppiella nova]|uniref:Uncharacterized protein n=1 Tax=Oppiella nova TaxID=334625 RepID=A0A7R9LEH3_9ACAR|nr:unnamed protein product [Oppiella nova]CAG2162848.1 unnamed protein product [Oppiella nova]